MGCEGKQGLTHTYGAGGERRDPHLWGGPTLMGQEEKGGAAPHLWGGRRKEGLTHNYGAGGGAGTDPHLWGRRRKEGLTHTYGAGGGGH